MSKLHVLPVQLANMIAAGEVVQRPSSVVKELMENAVDAGATDIKVIISDAGRTLIQVIDNGIGMSPADAVLCFERHATSKISTIDDLSAIESYGFRGEALASIAAIAELTLRTRRKQDETAIQVIVQDHGAVKTSSVAAPVGSNFAVRNLFYNTPARRKFLKSDKVELRHIVEAFTRIALTQPSIAFSLRSDDRDLFVLRPAKSLKFRILDLMGSNVAEDVVDLYNETTTLTVSGFLARPQSARKTVAHQYFFVNGRYFSSPYLRKAILKGYEGFIVKDTMPSWFIWLTVDPSTVDVNISPTKNEVKFEEESVVYQTLYACVKETLGRNAFGDGIDFDAAAGVQMPIIGRHFDAVHGQIKEPMPQIDPTYDPFASGNIGFENEGLGFPGSDVFGSPGELEAGGAHHTQGQDFFKLFPQTPKLLIVKGKYLVGTAASGLMVVNIRRAVERVAYEKSLRALSCNEHVSQRALFPVSVQVGTQACLLFESNANYLTSLGFDITPFGNDTVVVNAVPEGLSCEPGKVQQMVQDMILILSDTPVGGLQDAVFASYAAKFATLESLNFSINSPEEGQALIDALFACENAELTPSGKRILGIVSVEELDKKF
ncbi:MAG: DNA mismatch repair endonuclease MutL [Candidatus Cryptobacteroides sp.]|jgi:DNA mismatch repair protein MutL|nr:DNA mismatch repair endonuclease MutL [Rikenellaceae bacterium]